MTTKKKVKRLRKWRAWAELGQFSMADQFLWIDKKRRLKPSKTYIPVEIREVRR